MCRVVRIAYYYYYDYYTYGIKKPLNKHQLGCTGAGSSAFNVSRRSTLYGISPPNRRGLKIMRFDARLDVVLRLHRIHVLPFVIFHTVVRRLKRVRIRIRISNVTRA